jgi:Tol biopolymer transport system component/DNA-binding winged helix-turn-helix (wHTH) protein
MHEPAYPARRVRFGPFELDVRSSELRKGSVRLKVPSQSIEILKALLDQPGELVTRDQLRARLWPSDTFVDFEHGLNAAIRRLREALGDSADTPSYIETLPRRGYRFIAPIEKAPEVHAAEVAPASMPDTVAVRRRRTGWPILLLGGSLAVAVGVGLWIGRHHAATAAPNREPPRGAPVTSIPVTSFPGREADPAISPDGNYVAFAWDGDRGGNLDIYVKLLDGGGEPVRLTSGSTDERAPAWSPDGKRIAFLRGLDANRAVVIIESAFGGPERRLESTLTTALYWPTQAISWSPDGLAILFAAKDDSGLSTAIFATSIDTDTRRQLTTPGGDFSDAGPRISPDGRQLGFIRRVAGAWIGYPFVQPLTNLRATGEAHSLTDDKLASSFDWFPDGRSIVYDRGRKTLWRVSVDGGSPQPLLAGEVEGCRPSVARNVPRLVYQRLTIETNIWRVPGLPGENLRGNRRAPEPLIASTYEESEAQYSPDGQRIVFVSRRSGNAEIWVSASDGAHPQQLTRGLVGGSPRWSPDGRWIAFDSMRSGSWNIYVVSSQGGTERPLTAETSNNARASWSGDGQWIYFGSNRSGSWQIWKVPSAGGAATQLTRGGGLEAFESPDGGSLYFAGFETIGIWRVPVSGGEEVQVVNHGVQGGFAVTDRGLFLANSAAMPTPTIEFVDFTSRRISTVASLPPDTHLMAGGPTMHASRDGRWIIYTNRDGLGSDIMMIEGVR